MAFGKITLATKYIYDGWTAFNQLITDLLSVANGKGASQIGLEDAAGNLTAINLEDAIAEIYTDTADVITLNETFTENSATTTGLTWGYKGGTFRLDNVVTTKAAGTVAGLTDDDVNYIEIDPADGVMKTNITGFTSGRIPIREVTTVGGSQTVSTDKRAWFSQVAAATTSTSGIVELALDSEAVTGTSDVVVITPDNLTARLEAPGEIGGTTPAVGNFTNIQTQHEERGNEILLKDSSEETQNLGTLSANRTIDLTAGNCVSCTIGAALTFTFTNPPDTGDTGFLVLEMTNGAAHTVTWPGAVVWSGGSEPVWQTSGVDIAVFITRDAGTIWRGSRCWSAA
jgi:hypothetical protein